MSTIAYEAGYPERDKMLEGSGSVGRLAVEEIYLDGQSKRADLFGEQEKSFAIFMHSLILSNSSKIVKVDKERMWIIGSEAEKAFSNYAISKGFDKNLIDSIAPKINEFSFEPDSNLKASIHSINGQMRIVAKGEPDKLIKRCSYLLMDSKIIKLTRRFAKDINQALKAMLNKGLEVYALCIKDIIQMQEAVSVDNLYGDMAFVALVGLGKH